MENKIMVSHGLVTHPLKEAETCGVCKKVKKNFEEARANGEVDRLLSE